MRFLAVLLAVVGLTSCSLLDTRTGSVLRESRVPHSTGQAVGPARVPVSITPNGRFLLTTDDQHAGLYVTDIELDQTVTITRGYNAGYYANISDDGRFVSFKLFRPLGERFEQAAMIHDRTKGRSYNLSGWRYSAGTPAVSANGEKIAFFQDNELVILNKNRHKLSSINTNHRGNLVALSHDGKLVAYTNADEQIVVQTILSGTPRVVSDGANSYFRPVFSNDSSAVVYQSINGRTFAARLDGSQQIDLGSGQIPTWSSEGTPVYVSGRGSVTKRPLQSQDEGEAIGKIGPRWWALNRGAYASQEGDMLVVGGFTEEGIEESARFEWLRAEDHDAPAITEWPEEMYDDGYDDPRGIISTDWTTELTGVPYIHQIFDSPDGFDGDWACNVVSALMTLAYHRVIDPNPIDVSRPEPHRSRFGSYFCEVYSAGEYTFDIQSDDASGNPAAGGYGFIVRQDWKDTKNFMADYLRAHGVDSGVDWNPSRAKAVAEIKAGNPFVVLHSITLMGHYVTAIGMANDLNTIIVNDPYGNKNTRLYPSVNGKRVAYDLPGYNNGFQNLRIVHCFIWSRPLDTEAIASMSSGNS